MKGPLDELGTVVVTELLRRLRSRLFWFASLGGILAIAFLIEAPTFFGSIARASSSDIVIAGSASLRARAKPLLEKNRDFRVVASVATLPRTVTAAYLDAHGKAGAAVALSERGRKLHVDVYPRDLSAFAGVEFGNLAPLAIAVATGASSSRMAEAATLVRADHPLESKFADSRTAALAHGIAFGLIFVLYLAIILASQSVMSAVAEEKTSRIAEILVATIAPWNLLAGKTVAAAIIGLVQIGVWVATAALLLPSAAASLSSDAGSAQSGGAYSIFAAVSPGEIVAFFAFFVLGYLQYATVYAAAGSLISRTEDLGSVATPLVLPVVGAFVIAQYALLSPNAPLVVACSFVPFISPFVIFTRIAIADVPWWQTALAAAVDAAAVIACFWAAGKVYRVGMLLYGRVPSIKQVLAALRG